MTPRKTPEERLAESVAEMGVEEAEKHFRFIKAFERAKKEGKQTRPPVTRTTSPAAAKAAGGKTDGP